MGVHISVCKFHLGLWDFTRLCDRLVGECLKEGGDTSYLFGCNMFFRRHSDFVCFVFLFFSMVPGENKYIQTLKTGFLAPFSDFALGGILCSY